MVTVVAHVLRVVLLVSVWALEDLSSLPLAWDWLLLLDCLVNGFTSVFPIRYIYA